MPGLIDERSLRAIRLNGYRANAVTGAQAVRGTREERLKSDPVPLFTGLEDHIAAVIGASALRTRRIRVRNIIGNHVHTQPLCRKTGSCCINSQKHSHIVSSRLSAVLSAVDDSLQLVDVSSQRIRQRAVVKLILCYLGHLDVNIDVIPVQTHIGRRVLFDQGTRLPMKRSRQVSVMRAHDLHQRVAVHAQLLFQQILKPDMTPSEVRRVHVCNIIAEYLMPKRRCRHGTAADIDCRGIYQLLKHETSHSFPTHLCAQETRTQNRYILLVLHFLKKSFSF